MKPQEQIINTFNKLKTSKYLVYIIAAGTAIFLLLVFFIIFLFFGVSDKNNITKNTEERIEIKKKNIYGVEMEEACLNTFQEFLSKRGEDYSKCLNDFKFDEKFCGGGDPVAEGVAKTNIIVILDASGSMATKIGQDSRMDIAKKAVSTFLSNMPQGVNTGLIVYGNIGSNSQEDKNLSCNGIEEIIKLGSNNNAKVIDSMKTFTPKGWTPIAKSIDFAKNIFLKNSKESENYLILVTDGAESCDGNPLRSAQYLTTDLKNIKLNIIGFALDSYSQLSLEKVAGAGGGLYYTAYNSYSIADAFNNELISIKIGCLRLTTHRMYLAYEANALKNRECWLKAFGEESYDYDKNFVTKQVKDEFGKIIDVAPVTPVDQKCANAISQAIQNRSQEFWSKKEEIDKNGYADYKAVEKDFNKQIEELEKSRN